MTWHYITNHYMTWHEIAVAQRRKKPQCPMVRVTELSCVNLAYYSLERLSRTRKRWSIWPDKKAQKAYLFNRQHIIYVHYFVYCLQPPSPKKILREGGGCTQAITLLSYISPCRFRRQLQQLRSLRLVWFFICKANKVTFWTSIFWKALLNMIVID